MNNFAFSIGAAIVVVAFQTHADPVDSASCGAMTIEDQCRISWSFSRSPGSFYLVQQFHPTRAEWRTLLALPAGTPSQGTHDSPVEAGFLYRVLACDDVEGKTNCSGTTMVWAPFILPEEQMHKIPSRVPLLGSQDRSGKPIDAMVDKADGWVTALIQYNVYLMVNAYTRENIADLPDKTPVKDIRFDPPDDPIEVVQFNVYWAYSGDRGNPLDTPMPEQVSRPPHEHPEWHPEWSGSSSNQKAIALSQPQRTQANSGLLAQTPYFTLTRIGTAWNASPRPVHGPYSLDVSAETFSC